MRQYKKLASKLMICHFLITSLDMNCLSKFSIGKAFSSRNTKYGRIQNFCFPLARSKIFYVYSFV